MARGRQAPALIIHGGAGAHGAPRDKLARRRGMLAAARRGAEILRQGGAALDAVVAVVAFLEDDPLFNAGYGSVLDREGDVEMDAGLMVAVRSVPSSMAEAAPDARCAPAPRASSATLDESRRFGTGAVAAIRRVRNPIRLARAVMEMTPHVLMAGPGAERFARWAGFELCRPQDLVTGRSMARWRAYREKVVQKGARRKRFAAAGFGTVGGAALDVHGSLAAATSTGGYSGKLAGRVGDSAIMGAGFYADALGAASATGLGEAIVKLALCRRAVEALADATPSATASRMIAEMRPIRGAEAGIVILNRNGAVGYAHNAQSMEVAIFAPEKGVQHLWAKPLTA